MYIGVDLGGTNLVTGLVNKEGQILDHVSVPTEVELGSEGIINRISESVKLLLSNNSLEKDSISSIGIGIPGIADSNGVVIECVNLKWKNVDIKSELEALTGIKVFVGNDATVAGIAEAYLGSLKGANTAALLTLGTGVGGGFIVDGKVYSGKRGIASEVGHMVVGENFYDCNCGRNGCLETFSSATAVVKYAKKLVSETELVTPFVEAYRNNLESISCKAVFDYSKENDMVAFAVANRLAKYLAKGIVNLVVLLDVDMIAIGGGVAAAGNYLIELIEKEVEKERIFRDLPAPKILLAKMGNDAGIIGAAMLEVFN